MIKEQLVTKDPIFGMTIDETTAFNAERNGKTFYFCSDRCRQKLLSKPVDAKENSKPDSCSE